MQSSIRIMMRASSALADAGYYLADTGFWRIAIIMIAAAFTVVLLFAHAGRVASVGRDAVVAFSKARQLLHDADRENHKLPVPLSLTNTDFPGMG
jgi:hypothetical protein